MLRACDVYRGNCSKTLFYTWVRQGRVRLYKVGGNAYCDEAFDEIVRRLAAEDEAAARCRSHNFRRRPMEGTALPDEAA
jgi:hypothetical protein